MESKELSTTNLQPAPVAGAPVRKSIFAKKKPPTDTAQQQQVSTPSSSIPLPPLASEQLPSLATAGLEATTVTSAVPQPAAAPPSLGTSGIGTVTSLPSTNSSAPTQPGVAKRRSLFGRKVQTPVDEGLAVPTTSPATAAIVATQPPATPVDEVVEVENVIATQPIGSEAAAVAEVEEVIDTIQNRTAHTEAEVATSATDPAVLPLSTHEEVRTTNSYDHNLLTSSSAAVVMAESGDSSVNSTDRPQTPAMPQSITLSRYLMRVCEITGRLVPVLSEKVIGGGANPTSSSCSSLQQGGMMRMTTQSSTGGDDDDCDGDDGVFDNRLPPMLAYLHYLPYSHYIDAPVPRTLLRTRTTYPSNMTGSGDEGRQLPQSVRPLTRLVVGLVDTTLGGAVMADAIPQPPLASTSCYNETSSRPTSPTTSTPLNHMNTSSTSFAEGGHERSLLGTKRSRTSLDGGVEVLLAGDGDDDEGGGNNARSIDACTNNKQLQQQHLPSRPTSPQVLNTSFGTTTTAVGTGGGSCPSSLYSPGYPSTTNTSTLLGSSQQQQQKHHHSSNQQHHGSSSAIGTSNPFYVPVGFGVVPPNVVCRGIQEPVYLTLRFEKCLAACYTVCAKVVPEMQLGWSVHSTTMFYCHVFIRAHFWQDPESQQQRAESSCSPRRRGGGRNGASSPTTANPSTTATPTKPTTPTCPPPSFYDIPSKPPQQPPVSQQPIEMKRLQTMDPIILVAAALFLATKIENFKTPLNEIIGRVFDRHPNRPEHAKYKAMVLQAEIMLLATLGGNLTVIHPFDEIRQLSMGNQDVAKRANKLYSYTTMTPLALYVPRRELAASLVLLVAEEAKLLPSTSSSSSVPRSSSVRSVSANRPPSINPFARLLNGSATTMTAAEIDAGVPKPVALTAAHFETVMACLSAMMLVTEKRSGVARLDNRVQVKKSLIAHSEHARQQRNINTNISKK